MKVLVADDSLTMRRIIRKALSLIGYTDVAEAEDGVQAMEILDQGGIDLLITDWNMPAMNGLELVTRARAGNHKEVPILMVTTNATPEDVTKALRAGVNNYLAKPMTPEQLKEKIHAVMA